MRTAGLTLTLIGMTLTAGRGTADDAGAAPVRAADLVRMSRADLECLYRQAGVGAVPCGFVPGRAIASAGKPAAVPLSRVLHLIWQGKIFNGDGTMTNRVFGGLKAVPGRVYVGDSWLDGQPSLVIDYRGTSRSFGNVRDEVREVAPGVFLGLTYRESGSGAKLLIFFALDATR